MLVQAKSNLARLMATENLIVEERNVATAYFDPQNRILTVPILNGNLSPELYDLLLGHEVGHALETPAAGWHDSVVEMKVNKDILNVCEDARIEKKIKRKFPGLKPSFSRGYRELLDMDFFGIKNTNINTLNFIDRVNLYTKGGSFLGIDFTEEEKTLLNEIENTETFPEVVNIARKVQDFMKAELEEQKKLEIKTKIQVSVTSGSNPQEISDGETDEKGDSFDDVEVDTIKIIENEKDSQESKEKPQGKTKQDNDKEGSYSEPSANHNKELTSITDKNFREKEKTLYEQSSKADIIYSDIPVFNSDKCIIPFKRIIAEIEKENAQFTNLHTNESRFKPAEIMKRFVEYKNQSNKVVSYLVKEFEMRKNAEKQSRAKVSKTGELNMNRIYEYKLTDDIFRRMTNVPNGKSHGLVMFVDWSGSMQDHLGATIQQLLNLVMFCKKVNIPYEVYAFTTYGDMEAHTNGKERQKKKIGDLKVNSDFFLLNILSSKMKNTDFMKMASYLLEIGNSHVRTRDMAIPDFMALGGTPLNAAIISAFDVVPKFKENNKLQIVNTLFLTDGESCSLEGRIASYNKDTGKFYVTNENYPTSRRRSFVRDPVTKAMEEIGVAHYRCGHAVKETNALLKLLKQRIDCNLIGFFVARSRDIRSAIEIYSKDENAAEKLKTDFRKSENVVITTSGYDEYYFIRSEDMDTEEDELVVTGTTTRSFVSAFSKYTGNKVSSRIILNRFIKLIA